MQAKKEHYAIILCQHQVRVYVSTPKCWENIKLKGEIHLSLDEHWHLMQILEQLNQRVRRSNKLADIELSIVYQHDNVDHLENLTSHLKTLNCHSWQVLHWEQLVQRAIQIDPPRQPNDLHVNETWLCETLLPLLDHLLLHHQNADWIKQQKKASQQENQDIQSLQKERTQLQQQCAMLTNKVEVLEQKIQTLREYDFNQLIRFMPAIYRNFWSAIKPSDFAMLAGRLEIPHIPSPFPEPSMHTLMQLQKELKNLPESSYKELQDFCKNKLPHDLDVRPEMRFFFNNPT